MIRLMSTRHHAACWGTLVLAGELFVLATATKFCVGKARIGENAIKQSRRASSLISALAVALTRFLPSVAWADNLPSTSAHIPFGVYAHVNIEDVLPDLVKKLADIADIKIEQSTTQPCAVVTGSSSDQAALHVALQSFYATLLSDQAISGIAAGVHWCRVQIEKPGSPCKVGPTPCLPDGNDWSWVDDIFTAVQTYNTQNGANKTIQLIITPGVYSPSWLTDGAILKSCDRLFTPNPPPTPYECGMVTFSPYPEQRKALTTKEPLILPMPLPWNSRYHGYWRQFLADFAAKYGEDQALVSVIMAGPTAATTEMILPTTTNKSFQCSPIAGDPTQCSEVVDADSAWKTLIANSFTKSDPKSGTYAEYPAQVFVDYWKDAIGMYEQIFSDSNLALILTPDNYQNMPEFKGTSLPLPRLNNGTEKDFANFYNDDCSAAAQSLPISCQTKATVVFDFLNHSIPPSAKGKITKGTLVGGMRVQSPLSTSQIDLPGVKLVTAVPSPFTLNGAPLPGGPFIGGAEFDHELTKFNLIDNSYDASHPESNFFKDEACPCSPHISVEQGAFQVFATFFYGTKAAYLFDGNPNTTEGATTPPLQFQAPVQFVLVEWKDVMYALFTAGKCKLAGTTTSKHFPGDTLMQDVLNQADYGLKVIAGVPNIYPPALICRSSP